MPKHLPRVALLAVALHLASCAVGVNGDETDRTINSVNGAADSALGVPSDDSGLTPVPELDGGVPQPTGALPMGAPPAGARAPQKAPTASGACPEFAQGEAMFSPAGESARRASLWSGTGSGGALVIYWHSTGGAPSEAAVALSGVIEQITAEGGVVAAPYPGANEGMYPWVSSTPAALKVADEIVACAIAKKGVNPARIHTLGYSAGGLMAGSLGLQRSSYIASVAAYSGGQTATTGMLQDPTNKLSALLFHGGTMDSAGGTMYPTAASNYSTVLRKNGGFTAICNHNMGRAMPADGAPAVWRFFQDHPFGRPSPYAMALPPGFPSYCQAQP